MLIFILCFGVRCLPFLTQSLIRLLACWFTQSAKLFMRSSKFGLLHLLFFLNEFTMMWSNFCVNERKSERLPKHNCGDRSCTFVQSFNSIKQRPDSFHFCFWYGQVVIFMRMCASARYRVLNRIKIVHTQMVEIVKRNMINAFSPSRPRQTNRLLYSFIWS